MGYFTEVVSPRLSAAGSQELRRLPAELLILNRFNIPYTHLVAAWRAGKKLGVPAEKILIGSHIIDEATWLDAQTMLAGERRSAYENHRQEVFLLDQAINNLERHRPECSARVTFEPMHILRLFLYAAALLGCLYVYPDLTFAIVFIFLTFFYTAVMVVRLLALSRFKTQPDKVLNQKILNHQDLPTYSILVALHQEAGQIPELVSHLYNLDWPKEKLDIKLICEKDDRETIAAIESLNLPECFQLLAVPYAHPRTKPKALNFALPLVKGEFLVLYDAEDRPSPEQLKEAYLEFCKGEENLVCVQAPLLIHNHAQNWLTAMFAIEYYTLFKGLLPAFAKWHIPIPLGGTSNHFKTSILKDIGGWDPYNVTEDADLGIRIHRAGYITTTITAPTYEEAPPNFGVWVKQRTRWVKGWLQTLIVHNRHPIRFIQEIGLRNTIAYHLVLTSVVMSILLHPFLLGLFAFNVWSFHNGPAGDLACFIMAISAFNLIGGYSTYSLLSYAILKQRKENLLIKKIIFLPIYWIIISFAGMRALYQLIVKPHYWEKTPHGLANSIFKISSQTKREVKANEITGEKEILPLSVSRVGSQRRGNCGTGL